VDGLRFPYSAPDRPTGVATVTPDGSWSVAGSTGTGWAGAHLETLPGPAGPIEAVVYGGPHWRTAAHLVVALHGGPEGAWRFDFDPLFQRLAAAGVAVVAPNQRGSVGYGTAHRAALHGAWGGPDLADVRHLAGTLAAERAEAGVEPPGLYGVSYGAYLALLCVAHDPRLWSRCVALAPFLSAPRLRVEASVPVRAMVDRLGGSTPATDDLGPRDLWTLAPRIRTPLLIMHGTDDDVIPIRQSRDLVDRLRADGDCPVDYLEVPGAGHDPLGGPDGDPLAERLVEFLALDRFRNQDFRGRPVAVSGPSQRR
jgi:dipeptidyl aminopeptidase/acylaminoacyl peptidase